MFKRMLRGLSPAAPARPRLRLSVIVICYKMERQVGNTIRSLLPPYQQGIADFEIIVVDNGSPEPLPEETWKQAENVTYLYIPPGEASPNPGAAINRAVRMAGSDCLSIMIDGARMVTPGVLSWGVRLLELAPRAVVEVRGWHLGPKFQPESILEGYTHEVEKELLLQSRWWENGYRLFEICAASAQTREGFAGKAWESNCVFMGRALFDEIGGYHEGYQAPGGGLVNLDFFSRAVASASQGFTMLGEGTFHQVHGGAATGLTEPQLKEALAGWSAESKKLRGAMKEPDYQKFMLAGHLPKECLRWMGSR